MAENRTFKWSKVLLVASLGMNLIVVGVLAGAWLNGTKRGERSAGGPSFISGPFGRALSEEDRRAMRDTFRNDEGRKGRLSTQRREMRQIGVEIATVLRTEPFDPDALEMLFAKQARLGTQQRGLGQQALVDRITAMTPDQRAGFADRLEKAVKRGRPRSRKAD